MTIFSISQHRLDGAPFQASPNHGGAFGSGKPDAIIIHFTGGSSAESSIRQLCDDKAQNRVSAHVVIGRDGVITQLVPFNVVAWHAGLSTYGGRSGYNQYSIGIEIDNPGRLTRTEGGGYTTWFGRTVPSDQVVTLKHRNESGATPWMLYTEKQLDAVFALCAALCKSYPIREILGHEEIAPGRKTDPGPAFPLERLRDGLLGAGRAADGPALPPPVPTPSPAAPSAPAAAPRGFVAVDKLNIRSGPRVDAALVAPPLLRGTLLSLLDQAPGWRQVRLDSALTGWVKADYIKS